jgi:hypothetical protein
MTENPRVENSVITPLGMHPEDSDLISVFFMSEGFRRKGYSCLFDLNGSIKHRENGEEVVPI